MTETGSLLAYPVFLRSGLPQTFLNQKSRHGIQIDIIFPDYRGKIEIKFPDN